MSDETIIKIQDRVETLLTRAYRIWEKQSFADECRGQWYEDLIHDWAVNKACREFNTTPEAFCNA